MFFRSTFFHVAHCHQWPSESAASSPSKESDYFADRQHVLFLLLAFPWDRSVGPLGVS